MTYYQCFISPFNTEHTQVDTDGGQHPEWNENFSFSFKPPKLSSCKILSTEIAKMKIENIKKYVIIMVREGVLPAGK